MKSWDWVQWWEFVTLALVLILGLAMHGEPKKHTHEDFRMDFIAFLIMIPVAGRIFNLW